MATQERREADTGGGVSHLIKRPRLTKILDESEARIILLCAPAGYGKTTLAREWVATRREQVLWYSGGPAMADVAALAVDLAELFAGPESELVEKVRFLAARGEEGRSLTRAVLALAPTAPTLLVIDDMHFAAAGSSSDELIRGIVATTSLRVLIATRMRPSWIAGREVVYGEAEDIGPERLRFTSPETAALVPDGSFALDQAHGWPAVVGLAAFTKVHRAETDRLSPTQLYDFFARELFATAPKQLQASLLLLAAGGDATPAVRHEVLGAADEAVMEDAGARGFVVRDDAGTRAIHPLLRQFLIQQLRESPEPSQSTIVTQVMTALTSHQRWDECLSLMLSFPVESLAAAALNGALVDLLSSGRTVTLQQWVELATDNGFEDPIFVLAEAEVALRKGRTVEARALADWAAGRLPHDFAARAHLAASRASHQRDDIDGTLKHAEAALDLAESTTLKTEALWTALASAFEGDPGRLPQLFERLRDLPSMRPEHAYRVACAEAFVHLTDGGNILDALTASERAVALSRRVRDPLLRSNALNLRAHLFRVAGYYDDALARADELIGEAQKAGLEFVVGHALLAKSGALVGLRSVGKAAAVLREIEPWSAESAHVRNNATMVRARLRIAAGDLTGAARALDGPVPAFPPALRGELFGLRALVSAALGDNSTATRFLTLAEPASKYDEVLAYLLLARGILAVSEDREDEAHVAVVRCLRTGNADSVVTACRAYPELGRAAVQASADGEAAKGLEVVFSRSNDRDLGRRCGLPMPRELQRRSGLSRREEEVYELIIAGRTNAEIAKTLFISESTAKVHVRHIFEKLGVRTRAEAAALYREDQA